MCLLQLLLHAPHVLTGELFVLCRSCACPGCAALAVQAIRMAHIHAARLFSRVDKQQQQCPDRCRSVAQALSRVVFAHMCLLMATEAQQSPTRASVWRAEQCLQEWERLKKRGYCDDPDAALDASQVCCSADETCILFGNHTNHELFATGSANGCTKGASVCDMNPLTTYPMPWSAPL